MEETMSHLFPHKPKDYHAYWTTEGLSEFIARASLGSYENFNHGSILKPKQNKQKNHHNQEQKQQQKSNTWLIFFISIRDSPD